MKYRTTIGSTLAFASLAAIGLQGCSSTKKNPDETAPPPTADFQSSATATAIPVAAEIATDLTDASKKLVPVPLEKNQTVSQGNTETAPRTESGETPVQSKTSDSQNANDTITYQVKPGDTLMTIAFEHLGDLSRWREIYEGNRAKIPGINSLRPGTALSIRLTRVVAVDRNGKPYRIKRGDTLAKISNWVYGKMSAWRKLWENNRQLIHNPNWIYAGFTLYYQDSDRQIEMKKPEPLALAPAAPQGERSPASIDSN